MPVWGGIISLDLNREKCVRMLVQLTCEQNWFQMGQIVLVSMQSTKKGIFRTENPCTIHEPYPSLETPVYSEMIRKKENQDGFFVVFIQNIMMTAKKVCHFLGPILFTAFY